MRCCLWENRQSEKNFEIREPFSEKWVRISEEAYEMKWLYLLIALLCLSGCRKETTETYMELPPVVQEELSEEPENLSPRGRMTGG